MALRTAEYTAHRDRVVDVLHGTGVADPYRWLEDGASAATREWERRQAGRFVAARAGWTGRAALLATLRELGRYPRVSAPVARGDRLFFTRREPGADLPALVVAAGGTERVLVDLDPTGGTVLDAWSPSPDGRLLAYQVSGGGTEHSTLRVRDVASGRDVDGPIDRVRRTSIAWLPDGSGFYYTRRKALDSPYHRRVRLHRIGADPDGDPCVFGEGRGPAQFYAVAASPCGRWLTVRASEGSAPANDLWIADLTRGVARLRPVHEGLGAQTVPVVAGERLLLRTDLGAPMGRLVVAPVTDPGPARWRTLLAERPDAVLEDVAVLSGAGVLLATWLVGGAHEITVHDLDSGARTGRVELPGIGAVTRVEVARPGGDHGYLEYTDHATPPTVLRVGADGTADRLAGPSPVPGVVTTLLTVDSGGARVPVFVLSRAGRPDRPRPTVLTGYGGFGVPMTPAYTTEGLAWVRAGGVYAVAGVRGGGERGRAWHLDAVRDRRHHAFDDFDAVARHLTATGWTGPGMLAAHGSSNGGLLVCAALTRAPHRYAAAAAAAPLSDMVRYEASGMGPSWRDEYGTAADPDGFAALLSYSPYHRVVPGVCYPPVLLAAFDGDSRVDPLHARKMCAALRHASTGGPVLYRMEASVGHGTRPVSRALDLSADTLAFLADATGLDPTGGC